MAGNPLTQEATRIFVEEAHTDYGLAKRKAAERLGVRGGLPDNASIEAEVLAYQRLFGGQDYAARLQLMRNTAVQAMQLLAPFQPCLVGAVVSGAITDTHRVQLHCLSGQAEEIEGFLADRRLNPLPSDRDYRYPDGRIESTPLTCFEAGPVGIDIAHFADSHGAPLSPVTGRLQKRLNLAQAQALAQAAIPLL